MFSEKLKNTYATDISSIVKTLVGKSKTDKSKTVYPKY